MQSKAIEYNTNQQNIKQNNRIQRKNRIQSKTIEYKTKQ